jgi:hypothetical protein
MRLVSRGFPLDPVARAALQGAKFVQIGRRGAFRFQVRIKEGEVRDFIVGVVVDVLGKVRIELFQFGGVDGISAAAGDLVVLNSAKFVVLDPEVGFRISAAAANRSSAASPLVRPRRWPPWSFMFCAIADGRSPRRPSAAPAALVTKPFLRNERRSAEEWESSGDFRMVLPLLFLVSVCAGSEEPFRPSSRVRQGRRSPCAFSRGDGAGKRPPV